MSPPSAYDEVAIVELEPGMTLAGDLRSSEGKLVMSRGSVVTARARRAAGEPPDAHAGETVPVHDEEVGA